MKKPKKSIFKKLDEILEEISDELREIYAIDSMENTQDVKVVINLLRQNHKRRKENRAAAIRSQELIDTIENTQDMNTIMDLLRQNDHQRTVYRAAAKRLKELGPIDFDALQSIIRRLPKGKWKGRVNANDAAETISARFGSERSCANSGSSA